MFSLLCHCYSQCIQLIIVLSCCVKKGQQSSLNRRHYGEGQGWPPQEAQQKLSSFSAILGGRGIMDIWKDWSNSANKMRTRGLNKSNIFYNILIGHYVESTRYFAVFSWWIHLHFFTLGTVILHLLALCCAYILNMITKRIKII